MPVTGLTEAALISACLPGQRFSFIATSQRIGAWYRETRHRYGLLDRLACFRSLGRPVRDVASIQPDHGDALVALSEHAVADNGAGVIVPTGPLLAVAGECRVRIDPDFPCPTFCSSTPTAAKKASKPPTASA